MQIIPVLPQFKVVPDLKQNKQKTQLNQNNNNPTTPTEKIPQTV